MRGPLKSAIVAGLITEISIVVLFFAPRPTWLFVAAAMPAQPGASITLLLGLGGGPEGFPAPTDLALHVITFLLWWPTLELVRAAWGRYRTRRSTRPIETR
jgi:hypothetical protein